MPIATLACVVLALADAPSRPIALQRRPASFHVGYFGELAFHPGGFLGVQGRIVGNDRAELVVAGTFAAYVHVRNHTALMLYPELGGRVRLGRRVALEALGGLGYMHAFAGGPVFVVDEETQRVRRVRDAGRPSVMPTGSLGVSVATEHVAPFVRVQAFGQYPFNDAMLVHFAVLLGVRL